MRRVFLATILSTGLGLVPGRAAAVTVLTSPPLKGGAGGVVCSCSNLTGESLVVDIAIRNIGGASFCQNEPVSPGGFPRICAVSGTLVRTCTVSRDDGSSLSAKQLLCTLSAVDAAGNPTAVVPVDTKLKQ